MYKDEILLRNRVTQLTDELKNQKAQLQAQGELIRKLTERLDMMDADIDNLKDNTRAN